MVTIDGLKKLKNKPFNIPFIYPKMSNYNIIIDDEIKVHDITNDTYYINTEATVNKKDIKNILVTDVMTIVTDETEIILTKLTVKRHLKQVKQDFKIDFLTRDIQHMCSILESAYICIGECSLQNGAVHPFMVPIGIEQLVINFRYSNMVPYFPSKARVGHLCKENLRKLYRLYSLVIIDYVNESTFFDFFSECKLGNLTLTFCNSVPSLDSTKISSVTLWKNPNLTDIEGIYKMPNLELVTIYDCPKLDIAAIKSLCDERNVKLDIRE